MENNKVCILGPQPPPRHGLSSVNEAMALIATQSGLDVLVLNTAPISLSQSLIVRFNRGMRVVRALFSLIRFGERNPNACVYMSLSGGWGQLWEIIQIGLSRLLGLRIFLHHHSFRYIDADFWPMRLLVLIAGPRATHVMLGRVMETGFKRRYPAAKTTVVVSNAAFITSCSVSLKKSMAKVTFGHLANLSAAKGLDDILATAELSAEKGLPHEFLIAGPFETPDLAERYQPRIARLSNVRLVGAVYGESKNSFFEGIDIFLFPTRYRNEAEPLVILEAMSFGCPVIAFARGCIASMVNESCGLVINSDGDFPSTALSCVQEWLEQEGSLSRRSSAARTHFDGMKASSTKTLCALRASLA